MKRLVLDSATAAVKKFIRSLPIEGDGVQLELEGQVVCTVMPPSALTDAEKTVLIERGRELVRRSRQRNEGVPAGTIEQEVHQAVDQVRRRKKQ